MCLKFGVQTILSRYFPLFPSRYFPGVHYSHLSPALRYRRSSVTGGEPVCLLTTMTSRNQAEGA